jgi:2',3'-cyclic-nucleotide 2'-phosphodiesterase (5'-nucleotidase family)
LPSLAKPSPSLNAQVEASETAIDSQLPEDPATKAAIEPYAGKVRELAQPIGKVTEDMKKFGMGGSTMGNFVTDAMRNQAAKALGQPVILAITNVSGLRKSDIKAGPVSTMDMYELMPFDNALVTLDLTGEQLRRFLDVVVARGDAQSGARIFYRTNEDKKKVIISVRLGDYKNAEDISPNSIYTIVTIDYLVKRGGDFKVLQEGKNLKYLNLTLRDAMLDYIKAETAAGREIRATRDGRFRLDRSKPTAAPAAEEKDPK